MKRTWKVVKYSKGTHVSFCIHKDLNEGMSSNLKDFKKFIDLMMDDLEFRKMFSSPKSLQNYEDWLEND